MTAEMVAGAPDPTAGLEGDSDSTMQSADSGSGEVG